MHFLSDRNVQNAVSSKVFSPNELESKILPPPPSPTEISNFGSPHFVVPPPPLIYSIQVSPHPKFSTYV